MGPRFCCEQKHSRPCAADRVVCRSCSCKGTVKCRWQQGPRCRSRRCCKLLVRWRADMCGQATRLERSSAAAVADDVISTKCLAVACRSDTSLVNPCEAPAGACVGRVLQLRCWWGHADGPEGGTEAGQAGLSGLASAWCSSVQLVCFHILSFGWHVGSRRATGAIKNSE